MKITARKLFLPLVAIITLFFGAFVSVTNVSAADATVTNYEEFVAALSDDSTRIVVEGDITLEADVTVGKIVIVSSASTFDLNGYKMTLNKTLGIRANTTITGTGFIETDIENPIMVMEGDLTIENGTFDGGENVYAFIVTLDGYTGSVYVKDGIFRMKNIIINNYGSGKVVVSGGYFESDGEYVEDEWSDAAFMTSSDGTFEIDGEEVMIESYYRFLGDKFVSEDEDRGEVICKKGQVYEEMDWDDNWDEVDYSTYSFCGLDETLEEDEELDMDVTFKFINSNITIPAGITLTNSAAKIIVAEGSTIKICGEYDGDDDSLIEDGGTVTRECEEPADETNPATYDGFTYIIALLGLSGAGIAFGLIRAKATRR